MIVTENSDVGRAIDTQLLEGLVGPAADYPLRTGKAVFATEGGAGLDDGYPEPQRPSLRTEGDTDMGRPDDDQLRGAWEGFDEGSVAAFRAIGFQPGGDVGLSLQQLARPERLFKRADQYGRPVAFDRIHQLQMRWAQWLDQDLDLTTTAEPNTRGKLIADSVVDEFGGGALEDGLRPALNVPIDAATTDAPGNLP
jgi:hypothetical protein